MWGDGASPKAALQGYIKRLRKVEEINYEMQVNYSIPLSSVYILALHV